MLLKRYRSMKKKMERFKFGHRKLTLKVRFLCFWTTWHYIHIYKIQLFLLSYLIFGQKPKTYLIFYPSLRNLSTHNIGCPLFFGSYRGSISPSNDLLLLLGTSGPPNFLGHPPVLRFACWLCLPDFLNTPFCLHF